MRCCVQFRDWIEVRFFQSCERAFYLTTKTEKKEKNKQTKNSGQNTEGNETLFNLFRQYLKEGKLD